MLVGTAGFSVNESDGAAGALVSTLASTEAVTVAERLPTLSEIE